MQSPLCKICGARHHRYQPHEWPDEAPRAIILDRREVIVPSTSLDVTDFKKPFDRAAYQREYMRKWRSDHPNETPTAIYRCFDGAGALLYVGLSLVPRGRLKQHSEHSNWWFDVRRIEIEYYPTLPEARAVESAAVADEKPLHNKQLRQQSIAPPGQCQRCDMHRANTAAAMRRGREKKKDV
jgi:hypothetical protein